MIYLESSDSGMNQDLRSSSTTVLTRSSLRASRDMPGRSSDPSTKVMPLAASSSAWVTGVLASPRREESSARTDGFPIFPPGSFW